MNWYDNLKDRIKTKYAAELAFGMAALTVIAAKGLGQIDTWTHAFYWFALSLGGGALGFRQRVATGKLNAILQTQAVQVASDRRIPDDHPDLPAESRPYIAQAAENSPAKPDAVSQRATGGVTLP
jgi:hypothetical protein